MQTTSMQILKNNNQNKNLKGGFNMFKTMNKRIKNEKGLTLIELLAVIVILAIVAAIAVPAIGNIIEKQREKAVLSDAQTIISSAKLAIADGVCAEPTTAAPATAGDPSVTTTNCSSDNLRDFVDGVDKYPTANVTNFVVKTNETYTINWEVANQTFNQIPDATTNGATESQIQGWLD